MEIVAGDVVEVCLNEDGFLGSYFHAKVLGKVKRDTLLVEYETLLEDDDEEEEEEKKPLKEEVEIYKVRPVPPEIPVSDFDVLDKVDAFDREGWWVGRITGKSFSKYSVYFDSSGDELVYAFDELRVHQEYDHNNGQWFPSQRFKANNAYLFDGALNIWKIYESLPLMLKLSKVRLMTSKLRRESSADEIDDGVPDSVVPKADGE